MPIIMEGTPLSTSALNRNAPDTRPVRSNRKSAVSKPAGAAISRARPTVLAVPAIAVEMPPPGTPNGTTGWTRNPKESAGRAR